MRSVRLVLAASLVAPVALSAQAPSAATVAPADRRLSLAMYLDFEDVQDPQLSPDGRQIVFVRRWIDKINDRWESAIWVMNADGSKPRFLVRGSNPRWSPDGTRIAYLAEGEPRGTQIFVRWMDAEGATTQITRLTESPSAIAWSPDSRWIAFRAVVPKKLGSEWPASLPGRPEGARWTDPPRVIERLIWRRDRLGYLPEGYYHLFVVPAEGGTPRQVTSGDWDHNDPAWLDNRTLVFASLRIPDAEYAWRESEIYAVDVPTGAIRQLTNRRGPDTNPTPSPDGRWIAYTGYDWNDDTYNVPVLSVLDARTGQTRTLTAQLDRAPMDLHWSSDSRTLYFALESEGTLNLYALDVSSGRLRPLTRGPWVFDVGSVGGRWLVGVRTGPQQPRDVVRVDLRSGRVEQLTRVNDDLLSGVRLGELEEIWVRSADGLRVQGWILKPPGFDPRRKYPLMLSIHGGPHAMYNVGFNFGWQEHAANGYVVLYTNPRGSTGYGKAFGNAIKNAYPGRDYDDLMAAVDSVLARGYVDERNLFVYGCSGGGVLTAWIVGHTDRFRAASANCPVTNWLSFVGTTDGVSWYRNFAKLPWEDPTEHLRRSPLMYVGNVKTPTMIMTGELDLRTPMAQSEEYYQALKLRKVPTALVRFQGEWHGTTTRPSNFLRTQLYLRSWFERFMTPDLRAQLQRERTAGSDR